jgi:hypothetical protein
MHGLTWLELVEVGAPKMEDQCQISIKKMFKIKYDFFNDLDRWIM